MIKDEITKDQAIVLLKWSIVAGADEALDETVQYRFTGETVNNKDSLEINAQELVFSDIVNLPLNNELSRANNESIDKGISAITLANQCYSINDISAKIKDFPYFKLLNKKKDIVLYNGSTEPSVLIFQAPEINSAHEDDQINSNVRKLLFNRIFNSIDTLLSEGATGSCGSIVTYPKYFDNSEEAKDYNFQLIRPFLIRYIKLIQPQAIILMDGFLSEWLLDSVNVNDGISVTNGIKVLTLPSVDVLLRAPKRKKDVWNAILNLNLKLKKKE